MLLGLPACSSWLLPSGSDGKVSQFEDYGAAKADCDRIVTRVTRIEDLERMGMHPLLIPNLRAVTDIDLMQRFRPTALIVENNVDSALLECVRAHEACEGWVVTLESMESERTGDVSLELLRVQRIKESRGWTADLRLLILGDVVVYVVYKPWPGTPKMYQGRSKIVL